MTQSHSRGDQGRKEGGAADCTVGVGGIEGDGFEDVEDVAFGVQSMEVEGMEIENGNAVASWFGIFDRRSMIGGRSAIAQ